MKDRCQWAFCCGKYHVIFYSKGVCKTSENRIGVCVFFLFFFFIFRNAFPLLAFYPYVHKLSFHPVCYAILSIFILLQTATAQCQGKSESCVYQTNVCSICNARGKKRSHQHGCRKYRSLFLTFTSMCIVCTFVEEREKAPAIHPSVQDQIKKKKKKFNDAI